MLHQINIQQEKATKQLQFHTYHMPTCTYMFLTLSRYTNDYHYTTQICKLVGDVDSELIICIK